MNSMRDASRLFSFVTRSFLIAAAVALSSSCDSSRAPHSHNLLLVTIDTVRADHLGAYGYADARTPAIDSLALRGVVFEQAYTPAPMTLPAHSTMMTGLLPPQHGARVNGIHELDDDVTTLAEQLSARGYRTGAFVAAFVLNQRFGLAQGFDRYDDDLSEAYEQKVENGLAKYRAGDQVVDSALEWLGEEESKPFFAWVHLYDAHFPWYEHGEGADSSESGTYDGEIAFVDEQVGRLVEWLEASGNQDDTIVIVVSDHGEGLGDHHEIEHAYLLNEEVLHVPLIIVGPVAKPGHRVDAVVSLEDLHPTLVELLEVPSGRTQGRSLVAALEGKPIESGASYAETDLPWTSFRWAPQRSLTTSDWKYVRTPQTELYDRATDRGELANLAIAKKAVVRELEEQLSALEKSLGSRASTITSLSTEETEKLAALGYVASDTTAVPDDWSDLADMKERFPVKDLNADLRRRVAAETISKEEHVAVAARLTEMSPETPSFHAELGKVLVEIGDFESAMVPLKRAVDLAPEDAGVHYAYGDALQQMGKSDEARPHIEFALEAVPEMAAAHVCMGNILRAEGRLDLATGSYTEAIRLRGEYPEAHYNLAQVFGDRGMPDKAFEHFELALAEKPGWDLAHRALAYLLLSRGDFEASISHFEAAIAVNDAADLRNDLGVAYQNTGEPEKALEQYFAAMELAPDFFRPHLNRAIMAASYGNYEVALAEYEQAFKLAPGLADPTARLARFLATCPKVELRDAERAVVLAERAVDLTGAQSARALEILALSYALAERFPAALAAANRAQMQARADGDEAYAQSFDALIARYALGEPSEPAPSDVGEIETADEPEVVEPNESDEVVD